MIYVFFMVGSRSGDSGVELDLRMENKLSKQ